MTRTGNENVSLSASSSTTTLAEQASKGNMSASSSSSHPQPVASSSKTSKPIAPASRPKQSAVLPTMITPNPAPLSRQNTITSIHAHTSLRRMATHETGHFHDDTDDTDVDGLHTHDEHEREHGSSSDLETEKPRDEEEKVGTPADGGDEEGEKHTHGHGGKKAPELQDQTNLLPTKQVILVFLGLCCALFCSLLDQFIVTTALPTLGKVFNRADIATWVGTAYLLTSTAMQPIYGRLSDIFGRKVVLLGSLAIFLVGSIACAVAQSMIQLIVFRAIQGIGGGGILTLSMIIISDVVSLKERGKYQGIIGVVVASSSSIGPLLGGVFTEKATWRWCFYINIPLSVIAIIIIIILLPLRRVKGSIWSKLRVLDWYGSILTLAWAVLVLLALSWAGSRYSWTSAPVLAPLIIGIILLIAFLYVEAKLVPLPLVPMWIFKNGTVAAAMATTLFNGLVFYSLLYYLPTYYQVVRGESAIRSGVLLLPLITVQTVCSFTTGMLQSKTGDYWWNLTFGYAIWTVGLGLLSTIDENTSTAALSGYQVLTGIGAGQTFQTSLVAIQASVARKDMATATGIRNFIRMLGGTLGLTICSSIVNNIVRHNLDPIMSTDMVDRISNDPTTLAELGLSEAQRTLVIQAYARGIQACFWFMIPCAGIAFFLTVFFIKKISLKREDDAIKKAEAKAWVESKKAKHHKEKHPDEVSDEGAERTRQDSVLTLSGEGNGVGGKLKELEREVEEAGRGEDEVAGMQPGASEGFDQGPVGTKHQ